jgi:hypothetical protein
VGLRGGGAAGAGGVGAGAGFADLTGAAAAALGAGRFGVAFRAAGRAGAAFFAGRGRADRLRSAVARLLAARAGLRAEVRDLVTRRDLAIDMCGLTRRTRLAQ